MMVRKKSCIFGVILVLVFPIFGFGMGSEATDTDKILLVTGEWPPYTSENMEGLGFFTAIVTTVFKEMNLEPEYKFYPWTRCELLLKQGKAFAAFPYAYTKERAKEFWFSDLMTIADTSTEPTKLFYYNRQASDFKYEKLEDLRAYKVAGIAGYYYLDMLEEANIPFDYSDNEEVAFRKLVAGRVDLVPIAYNIGIKFVNKLFPDEADKFGTLEKTIGGAGTRLMISPSYRNSKELLEKFNIAFRKIVDAGMYAQILKKYDIEEVSILEK